MYTLGLHDASIKHRLNTTIVTSQGLCQSLVNYVNNNNSLHLYSAFSALKVL